MTCSVRPQVNFAQSAVFAQSLHNVVHVAAAQLINIAVRFVKKSYNMERSCSSFDYYFEKIPLILLRVGFTWSLG